MRKAILAIFLCAGPAPAGFAEEGSAGAALPASDVSLAELSLMDPVPDAGKPLRFRVVVHNTGDSEESNIGVKLSIGGVDAQDSPRQVLTLAAGDRKELVFTATPRGLGRALAVACVDTFDDNIADNCKTRAITTEPGASSNKVDYDVLRAELQKRLAPDAFKELEGYTFQSVECKDCIGSELDDFLAALIKGEAALTGASITETEQAPARAREPMKKGRKGSESSASVLERSSVLDLELLPPAKESLAADYYLVHFPKGGDSGTTEYILKVVGKKVEKTNLSGRDAGGK